MKKLILKLINSYDNKTDGFSARKLTAYAFVLFSCYIHYKFINFDNSIEALMIDSAVVLVALGIITAQNLIELKNGNKEDKNPNE